IARGRFEWSRFSPWMIVLWYSWLTPFVCARRRSRQFAMTPHTIRSIWVAVLSGSLIFLTERCARLLYLPRRPDLFAEAPLGEGGIDMDLLPAIGTGVTLKRNVCEQNFFRSSCDSRHAPRNGSYHLFWFLPLECTGFITHVGGQVFLR